MKADEGNNMTNILNITNGDTAVTVLKSANITGDFLPWQDVLHDGPVPSGLSLTDLSSLRAKFIASQGWAELQDITNSFHERDLLLKTFYQYDEITLWFEHDLYDQLQMLQILDWFAQQDLGHTQLSLICTEHYIGSLQPERVKDCLSPHKEPITQDHFDLATEAWSRFCDNAPYRWAELINYNTHALPFLRASVIRLLEEFPDPQSGLSRTAYHALSIISEGIDQPLKIFRLYSNTEDRKFLGDTSFWSLLNQFIISPTPLLILNHGEQLSSPIDQQQSLTITPLGQQVLAEEENWLDYTNNDFWKGGTHFTPANYYCWDNEEQSIKLHRKG